MWETEQEEGLEGLWEVILIIYFFKTLKLNDFLKKEKKTDMIEGARQGSSNAFQNWRPSIPDPTGFYSPVAQATVRERLDYFPQLKSNHVDLEKQSGHRGPCSAVVGIPEGPGMKGRGTWEGLTPW